MIRVIVACHGIYKQVHCATKRREEEKKEGEGKRYKKLKVICLGVMAIKKEGIPKVRFCIFTII